MNSQMDNLAALVRERQAEMRREAWVEQQLRQPAAPRQKSLAMKHKFAVALAAAVLIAFSIAQVADAVAGLGGAGLGPQRML